MNLRRSLRLSLRALFAQKVKAFLAVASVSIGVAAVALIGAVAAGAQREVAARLDAVGTNLIVVRPAQVERTAARKTTAGPVTTLTMDDFDAIAALPFVAAASVGAERAVRAKGGNTSTNTRIIGVSPAYPVVKNVRVREGRFFGPDDEKNARRVAVLGFSVATALFENRDAVGGEIRVRGVPFEVIGVLESKGVLPDGSNEDDEILVPARTALRRVFNTTWLTSVFVSVTDPAKMEDARRAITALVRARHGRDDFGVQNTTRLVAMQKEAADFLEILGLSLGGVALVVGGTGILALMTMSVKQRTGEIGLRMALGATPRTILVQFLFEGTLLAAGGWLTGVAIGALGAVVMKAVTEFPLAWPVEALLASAAMVLIAGLGFSSFPARRASMLQPMEALRLR